MKRTALLLVLLVAVGAVMMPVSRSSAQEEEKTITAIGVADAGLAQARDEAIEDALRKAVEQGVGVWVAAELTVEQKKLIDERIYSETAGYVKEYNILEEGEKLGLYQVKISALVKLGKLADDLQALGLLMRKKRNPRLMVIVRATQTDDRFFNRRTEASRSAENIIESELKKKDFRLVDAAHIKRLGKIEGAIGEGKPAQASNIAKDYGAEILVLGEVWRDFLNTRKVYGRTYRFYSNEVRLKALDTDTGAIIFSGTKKKNTTALDYTEPIEEASRELTRELIEGIAQSWKKDVYVAGEFQLRIAGIDFATLARLKDALGEIRGVSEVVTRSFQAGSALLEVRFKGDIDRLASKVSEIKDPPVEISGLKANSLELRLK